MSERATMYLLPMAKDASVPRSPAAAKEAVAAADRLPEGSGLHRATSSDSWHPTLAAGLARACSIEGLGFLASDLRVLSPDEARLAANAADELLRRLEAGEIPQTREPLGRQWHLIISQADIAKALAAVVPCTDVDEENGETQSFLEFLVTLQVAAGDAADQATGLLYLRTAA